MVTVNDWGIQGDLLKAHVSLYGDSRDIIAIFKISTEEIRINTKLTEDQGIDIKKALIAIYLKYKKGNIKPGERQIVAWG